MMEHHSSYLTILEKHTNMPPDESSSAFINKSVGEHVAEFFVQLSAISCKVSVSDEGKTTVLCYLPNETNSRTFFSTSILKSRSLFFKRMWGLFHSDFVEGYRRSLGGHTVQFSYKGQQESLRNPKPFISSFRLETSFEFLENALEACRIKTLALFEQNPPIHLVRSKKEDDFREHVLGTIRQKAKKHNYSERYAMEMALRMIQEEFAKKIIES